MSIDSIEQKVIDILNGITGAQPGEIDPDLAQPGEIDPDLALFDEGLLDSFATIQMVLALEEGFGLHLEISELSREQMATPAKIARTIGGMLS